MAQAVRYLQHARSDLDQTYFEWACFSAQQAAEKAVKAVFQKEGAEVRGHSITDMLVLLTPRHPVSDALTEGAKELDKAYIPTRYPDAHPSGSPGESYTRAEAQRMIEYADGILRFCQSLLA